jgi:hypothetical protein
LFHSDATLVWSKLNIGSPTGQSRSEVQTVDFSHARYPNGIPAV